MTQPIDIITRAMKNIGAAVHTPEVVAAYKEDQNVTPTA